jgi:puromycin-sensitive aminopeptidase
MLDAPTPQEQDRYRYALARFRDPALMQRTVELAVSGEVRTQDAPFLLSVAEANRDFGPIAWRYVRDHWDELVPRFASSNVIHLAGGVRIQTDPEIVADVQAFFAEHDIPQSHLMLLQGLERQRVFAALRERAAGELAARFGG